MPQFKTIYGVADDMVRFKIGAVVPNNLLSVAIRVQNINCVVDAIVQNNSLCG